MGETVAYVGVDYHSSVIQVCAVDADGVELCNRRCANHWRAVAGCVDPGWQVQACIEATSGAADLAEELIAHGGWSVVLAHPGYVARMRGNPDKSDVADARLLADLRRVWLAPVAVRELRLLIRQRQSWVDRRRAVKLRIGALLREQRHRWK